MEVLKALQDTINISTARKKKIKALISLMKNEEEIAYEDNAKEEHSKRKSGDEEKSHSDDKEEEQFISVGEADNS